MLFCFNINAGPSTFNIFVILLLLDPHFVAWGLNANVLTRYHDPPSLIHTFYGACDTIAFETSKLQLQVRTRPGGGWSGVVQVGLKWLPTGETIFLFNGSLRLVENNVANYSTILNYERKSKQSPSGYAADYVHYFHFLNGPANKDNFIFIEEWKYGLYNIEIKGNGSTFAGSKGSLGAWNRYDESKKFILRDNVNTVYTGNSIFDVINSWRVKDNGESILNNPSTICTSSGACGTGVGQLPCIYGDTYRNRKMMKRGLQSACNKTCDDLTTPLEKDMCQSDVSLSGDTDWACQVTYTDPIIYESEFIPSGELCDVVDVLAQTLFLPGVPGAEACWRVQLATGGTLEGDFTDPSCSKTESEWQSSNGVFSIFDSISASDKTVVFIPGTNGFSGTFQFVEDPTVTQASLQVLGWVPTAKEFAVEVTIPTCSADAICPTTKVDPL